MGTMREAIERTVSEDGVVEERYPFVDGPITRDDRGGVTVTLDQNIVDVARLLSGELAQSEIVEDHEVGREPAAQFPLEGVVGARLVQGEEQLSDLDVADMMPGATGAVAERLGEPALADPDRPAEDHVFRGTEPVQSEQFAHTRAVVADGRVPHELLVGDDFLKAGRLDAA